MFLQFPRFGKFLSVVALFGSANVALADPTPKWKAILANPTPQQVKAPVLLQDLAGFSLQLQFADQATLLNLMMKDRTWISSGLIHGIEGFGSDGKETSDFFTMLPGSCSFVISDQLKDAFTEELTDPTGGVKGLYSSDDASVYLTGSSDKVNSLKASEINHDGNEHNQLLRFENSGAPNLKVIGKATPRRLVLFSADGNIALVCLRNSVEPYSVYSLQRIFGNRVQINLMENKK